MILEGTTSSGAVVPVQVTTDGKVVAEGRTGPEGPQGPEGPEGPQGPEGPAGSPGNLWSGSDPGPISYTGGSVGIGTASPAGQLSCTSDFVLGNQSSTGTGGTGRILATGGEVYIQGGLAATSGSAAPIVFTNYGGVGERARFDTSGRLLVGTSSARSVFSGGTTAPQVQIDGTQFRDSTLSITRGSNDNGTPGLIFGKSRSTGNLIAQSGDGIGVIAFEGNDGAKFLRGATIAAYLDGTPGTNDMPGRLVFSTTADGASSPTERMAIDSQGDVVFQGAPIIRSPDGRHWAIEVDNNGNLSAIESL